MSLNNIIKTNFPGLIIRKPLFYMWDIGLRFELNRNLEIKSDINTYLYKVLNKAKEIYGTVIDPQDEIIVIYQEYIGKDNQKYNENNFCFDNINQKDDIEQLIINGLYDNKNDFDVWKQILIKTNARNINESAILSAITNSEFNKNPRITGIVFFYNISKNIIIHMYDDRGLDIIAKSKDAIKSTYLKFNSLIPEFDKEEINNRFKI